MTGLSLVALGQKGLVGVVDATIHDLWSHQVGSGEPGISGSLVGLMVFDTDPLVETRRRQIDEVHAPIVLRNSSQRGWFGFFGQRRVKTGLVPRHGRFLAAGGLVVTSSSQGSVSRVHVSGAKNPASHLVEAFGCSDPSRGGSFCHRVGEQPTGVSDADPARRLPPTTTGAKQRRRCTKPAAGRDRPRVVSPGAVYLSGS